MNIIITEKQLNEVLGVYLDLGSNDGELKKGNYDSEVLTSEKPDKGLPKTNTTDQKAHSSVSRLPLGYSTRHAAVSVRCSLENEGEVINESNRDLEGKTFALPQKLFELLSANLKAREHLTNVDGIMRLKNILNMKGIKTGEMYRLRNFFKNADTKSDEYQMLGGKEMERWIEQQLKVATDMSAQSKDIKLMLGYKNSHLKSAPKEHGNGQGHSEKVTFTYEG